MPEIEYTFCRYRNSYRPLCTPNLASGRRRKLML